MTKDTERKKFDRDKLDKYASKIGKAISEEHGRIARHDADSLYSLLCNEGWEVELIQTTSPFIGDMPLKEAHPSFIIKVTRDIIDRQKNYSIPEALGD